MLASILILILFLPVACLPLALDTLVSSAELKEMGISLENSDDTFPMQGYELICITQDSDKRKDTRTCYELYGMVNSGNDQKAISK